MIPNRTIFTGDNLPIMRGMNSESVDLIYLDPPFNSNHNYAAPIGSKAAGAAFKDTWTLSDVDVAWMDELRKRNPDLYAVIIAVGKVGGKSGMSYLIYMAVRILEMHRVLKNEGSIYLHCDPTMGHSLRMMMDAIFGSENFRNEIFWRRTASPAKGSQHRAKSWGSNADILLFYTKTDEFWLMPTRELTEREKLEKFPKVEKGRRYNTATPVFSSKTMGARPNLCFEWRGFRNPHPSGWRLSKERLEKEYQKGNIVIKDGKIERRAYFEDYQGLPLGNLWAETELTLSSQDSERIGFPTQKPLALLERIIEASSDKGDVVFDPFCGCATTLIAAEKLQRHWIGIDISLKAVDLVKSRLYEEVQVEGVVGKLHHRRAPPQRTDLGKLPPPHTHKKTLYGEQGGHCAGCQKRFEIQNLEIDHIIPKKDGGTDHADNLQLLCGHCNRVKGRRTMEALIADLTKRGVFVWQRREPL